MVKVRIFNGKATIDKRLQAHLKRRLDFALGSLGDRVGRIIVRLSDAELSPVSPLKHCEIEVVMLPRSVSVADTGADLFIAIQNAAHRLKRSIARALEREQAWAVGHPARHVPPSAATRS